MVLILYTVMVASRLAWLRMGLLPLQQKCFTVQWLEVSYQTMRCKPFKVGSSWLALMALPSLRYVHTSYNLNNVFNHISSLLSCLMILAVLWISHISLFANLEHHLYFHLPFNSWTMVLQTVMANSDMNFSSLLKDFIRGSGIPCPQLFNDAKIHFNPIINLEHINNSGFRSQVFCWAVTGSCERESDATQITVSFFHCSNEIPLNMDIFQIRFISDNDPLYNDDNNHAGMIYQSKVAFRTCFHLVLIPASYVIQLANQAYSTMRSQPFSFCNAFDHWMLCETLNAIENCIVMWRVPTTFTSKPVLALCICTSLYRHPFLIFVKRHHLGFFPLPFHSNRPLLLIMSWLFSVTIPLSKRQACIFSMLLNNYTLILDDCSMAQLNSSDS